MSANRTRGWATWHRHPGADLRLSVCPACLTQAHALPPCPEGFFHPAHSHPQPGPAPVPPCALVLWWSGRGWSHAQATVQPGLLAYFLLPARSLWELTFQHCALFLPRPERWRRPRPGAQQEGGWAAEGAGAQVAGLQVPGEVAVLSPHPRAPGGPDGRHVPPTGADNLLLQSAQRRRRPRGAGPGAGQGLGSRLLRGKRCTLTCLDRWSLRANFFSHTGHW